MFTPGPVNVSDRVRAAQAGRPMYHRGTEYGALLTEASAMLGEVLGTAGEVHCVSGSGTGAVEMAVQNLCRPGDRVVVASNGYFGERLVNLCRRLGLDVAHVSVAWCEELPLDRIDHALGAGAVAVIAVHHETSTGRVNDLSDISALARKNGALSIIDAISSAGVVPVEMDRHRLDAVIATSQKGIGGTPGVGVLAASTAAWERLERLPTPGTFAGDWTRVRRSARRQPAESQWTPPVSVMAGMHAALIELTRGPSLKAAFAHRAGIGGAIQAGLSGLGFTPWPAGAAVVGPVTVAHPPPGVPADAMISRAWDIAGVRIVGGQGPLDGRAVRITHLGIDMFQVYGLIAVLALALQQHTGRVRCAPLDLMARAYAETIAGGR